MKQGLELFNSLKPGDKFRSLDQYLYHVRGRVDGRIVARFWSKHKKRWCYEVLASPGFEFGMYYNEKMTWDQFLEWRRNGGKADQADG